jgi:GTPase SAR1 family protein
MGVSLPVVLVANKSDLGSEREAKRALTEEMIPVMHEFKEVESCVRCSAKERFNVNEVPLPQNDVNVGVLFVSAGGYSSYCSF